MAKEIVRHGEDYEIEYAGDAFIGPPRSILKVNGTDGTMTMGNITIGPDGKAQFDGATVDEANLPTASQKAALVGTSGTVGSANKYVTNADARNTNARTPTAHAASHNLGGSDALGTTAYTPTTAGDWAGTPPNDVWEALDRIATLLKSLNSGTGA